MKKIIYLVLILMGFNLKSQDYNFPPFNNNIALNDSVCDYSFVLVGTCGGPPDYHTLALANNSALAPIASSVNLQFAVKKVLTPPSATVYCTQTGTTPVLAGSVFKFTNAVQQFSFTCTPSATVIGKFMVNGTPTVVNETYECGFHISVTLGACNNVCTLTGLNKWLPANVLCNVGTSNHLKEGDKNISLSLFPNPVNDNLSVKGDLTSDKLTYKIINLQGKIIQESSIKSLPANINCSSLSPGVYQFVLYNDKSRISSSRLVKK